MSTTPFTTRLFYSYCHKDKKHKAKMEIALALLREKGLTEWSDQQILPGQQISQKVRREMNRADILVFFLSQDFIASEECMKEWNYTKDCISKNKLVFRVPIIVKSCAWKDLLESDDIKAQPEDGKPVSAFGNGSTAWNQVYEGLKEIINQLRNNFTPRQEFLDDIQKTEFSSQQGIKLEDIYTFLTLKCYPPQTESVKLVEEKITSEDKLLAKKYSLIHGEEMSGKTALARHVFLFLYKRSKAVLLIDLNNVAVKPREQSFIQAYQKQFHGDYTLWKKNLSKTLILDNLSPTKNSFELIALARNLFDKIIVLTSTDSFYSFFKDEYRLSDFYEMSIDPLTHVQQESLIRARLNLLEGGREVTDGFVDQIERRVNSIIISNKVVPRYPFFVLSILQTCEAFMPDNMSITSYGHCYHALIVSSLIKSGISRRDKDINTCFNFAEELSFRIYQHNCNIDGDDKFNFTGFVAQYRGKYILPQSILNRLTHAQYGILRNDGIFRTEYMYYFFLGRFFSKDKDKHSAEIDRLCDHSYIRSNHLILLFIIQHTIDIKIIDNILLRTMCTLDKISPAVLDNTETKRFSEIITGLSQRILSSKSVSHERKKEREELDRIDNNIDSSSSSDESKHEQTEGHPTNDLYRILKCNKVLGQILKNQYGRLEKQKIEELIEVISDGGLRLVNWVLKDEQEIHDLAAYIHEKYSHYDDREIRIAIRWISFMWTMINIEAIVSAINAPEISNEVSEVVTRKATPAYDLIGYFSHLDSTSKLSSETRNRLASPCKKYHDPFLRSVLSIRTQHYMNTHSGSAVIQQSICSLLNIQYQYRSG